MADSVRERLTRQQARAQAAVLVAEDDVSDEIIADRVGIAPRTLYRWKRETEFAAHVGDHIGQIQAGMLKLTIAKKHKRLKVLDDLHDKALRVIEERAARHALAIDTAEESARRVFGNYTVPEAATGLLVKEETVTASGLVSTKWSVDIGLLKEIRAQQEQAAKELGQWIERGELGVTTSIVQLVGIDAEDI